MLYLCNLAATLRTSGWSGGIRWDIPAIGVGREGHGATGESASSLGIKCGVRAGGSLMPVGVALGGITTLGSGCHAGCLNGGVTRSGVGVLVTC